MRKQVGGSAGILALLAVLIHTQFGVETNRAKPPQSAPAAVESESPANERNRRDGLSKAN